MTCWTADRTAHLLGHSETTIDDDVGLSAIGTLDAPTFAPVTGYIAFLTLSLYVAGLILLALAVNGKTGMVSHTLVDECRQLSVAERQAVREAILDDPGD